MHTYRSLLAPVVVLVATLAGCGDHESHSAETVAVAADAPFNQADVTLAQGMIPHHRQAVDMADLVTAPRQAGPEVSALAARIKAAQQPEIDQMTAWLGEWGAPVPEGTDHGDHGGAPMAGMMTADEMTALGQASGPAFDRLWVDMMIRHHQGALVMAEAHLAAGKFGPTLELSKAIVAAQTAEIAEMQALLATFG